MIAIIEAIVVVALAFGGCFLLLAAVVIGICLIAVLPILVFAVIGAADHRDHWTGC